MGFFSWETSDTGKSISNTYSSRGTFTVYVPIPKEFGGGMLKEDSYEGYGVFGGRDVYALVAQWNFPELCKDKDGELKSDDDCRGIGIEIACYDYANANLKYPIKITERPIPYEEALPSKNDQWQGYFYDDEEEESDGEEIL